MNLNENADDDNADACKCQCRNEKNKNSNCGEKKRNDMNYKIVIIYTGLMQPHSFIVNHVKNIFIKSARQQREPANKHKAQPNCKQ